MFKRITLLSLSVLTIGISVAKETTDVSRHRSSHPGSNTFDKHFKITREEVESFTADFAANGSNVDLSSYPNVKDWPGNGNSISGGAQAHYLAPFYDLDGDGIYNPQNGDFPAYYFKSL